MIDIEGPPTEIVHHFADRESLHRRKGAARHVIDGLTIKHGEEGGILLVQIITLPAFAAPGGRGGGSTLWGRPIFLK
jgi:hypothetical protein